MTLYHDFIFLYDLKFQVAVACSRCLESAVQREVREHEKKRGGKRGRGREVGIPYSTPSPRCFSYSHLLEPSLQSEDQEHAKVAVTLRYDSVPVHIIISSLINELFTCCR